MEYAVIKSGSRQYKISKGNVIKVDRLTAKEGDKIPLDKVLLFAADDKIEIGKPFLSHVKVEAKVIAHGKLEKIAVRKFKAKSRYRRTTGFTPQVTSLQIESIIVANAKKF